MAQRDPVNQDSDLRREVIAMKINGGAFPRLNRTIVDAGDPEIVVTRTGNNEVELLFMRCALKRPGEGGHAVSALFVGIRKRVRSIFRAREIAPGSV